MSCRSRGRTGRASITTFRTCCKSRSTRRLDPTPMPSANSSISMARSRRSGPPSNASSGSTNAACADPARLPSLSPAPLDLQQGPAQFFVVGLDCSRPAFLGISPKHCTLPAQRAKAIGGMIMPSNVHLLYVARGVRGFGDGFATIILPAYLTAIGYDIIQIGVVLTASLLGTAVLTLLIGTIAPRHDLRTLMLSGAGIMTLTGLAFPSFQHIAFIAVVA